MKFADAPSAHAALSGKIVRFTRLVDTDFQFQAEAEWMGKVVEVTDYYGHHLDIVIDFTEFEANNALHMTANYWDENMRPVLKVTQTCHYKPVASLYVDYGYELPFEIVSQGSDDERRQVALAKLTDEEKRLLGLLD